MKLFDKRTSKATGPVYSECETSTAGPTTPTHFRELTAQGKFPSGGADTLALCGRKVAWDLPYNADVKTMPSRVANQHETFRYCDKCLAELEQRLGVTFG